MNKELQATASSAAVYLLSWQDFFAKYRSRWEIITANAGNDNLMLSLPWLQSWYEAFCCPGKERILVVEDGDGRCIGAVFMHLQREKFRSIPANVLRLWVNSHSHRSGSLAPDPALLAYHLGEYLSDTAGQWDLARFQGIASGNGFAASLKHAAAERGLVFQTERQWANNILPLNGSWDDYYRGLSSKGRQKGERLGRRLGDIEKWECRRYSSSEMNVALQHYYRIENQSWKAQTGEVISTNAQLWAYYDSLISRLTERGHCLAYVLHLGEEPIAAVLALKYQGRLSIYKTSFVDAYQKYSPGWLVYCELIRDAYNNGIRVVDLFGNTRHTQTWSKDEIEFEDLQLFSPSLRGRSLYAGRWLINRMRGGKR